MSQYRLLIADDEEIARKALRLLIAKELPEVELLQDAANGIELVALVQELQPDIAIVDVNMPGMSGIEAVDLLCARGCKTRFIIHTAYDEFAYVQKALVLKVDAYLLKPSKREVTVDTIRRLCNQISQAKALQQSQSQMRELFARISPIMESEILYSLFIGEPATASFDSYCEMYNIRFTGGVVATVVPFGKGVAPPWQKERAQLRQVLEGALGGNCQYLTAVTESNLCLLLLLPEDVPAEQRPTWLEDILHVTVDRLARQYSLPLRVGVGCISDTFSDMERSYRESCMALLDTQTAGIYFYLGQEQPRPLVGQELASLVVQGNLPKIALVLENFHGGRAEASALWEEVCRHTTRNITDRARLDRRREDIASELAAASGGWSDILCKGAYALASLVDKTPEQDHTRVGQAREYIRRHYSEDVSLEEVAEACGVSSYYLSRQFRVEQGKNFVEYLTEVRMTAAVQLALETHLSVKEIAERTGYSNPTYFCRVFKKYTGKTIGEVREQGKQSK